MAVLELRPETGRIRPLDGPHLRGTLAIRPKLVRSARPLPGTRLDLPDHLASLLPTLGLLSSVARAEELPDEEEVMGSLATTVNPADKLNLPRLPLLRNPRHVAGYLGRCRALPDADCQSQCLVESLLSKLGSLLQEPIHLGDDPGAVSVVKGRRGMPPPPIIEPQSIDTSQTLVDQTGLRKHNSQRFEMEQLTAIVHLDTENHVIVGYKDVGDDEFWIRGHMPDYPLMPGVLMCEVAAQLSSWYCKHINLMGDGGFVGFGGMEEVRFRGQVRPGDRLIVVGKGVRMNRRQTIFDCQGFIESQMVFHARIIGVPISNPASS